MNGLINLADTSSWVVGLCPRLGWNAPIGAAVTVTVLFVAFACSTPPVHSYLLRSLLSHVLVQLTTNSSGNYANCTTWT
jgi:hypothetical protein